MRKSLPVDRQQLPALPEGSSLPFLMPALWVLDLSGWHTQTCKPIPCNKSINTHLLLVFVSLVEVYLCQ